MKNFLKQKTCRTCSTSATSVSASLCLGCTVSSWMRSACFLTPVHHLKECHSMMFLLQALTSTKACSMLMKVQEGTGGHHHQHQTHVPLFCFEGGPQRLSILSWYRNNDLTYDVIQYRMQVQFFGCVWTNENRCSRNRLKKHLAEADLLTVIFV